MDIADSDYLYFFVFPGKKQYVKRLIGKPGDTLYFYCREGHGLRQKLLDLDLPNMLNRPATLEDVFLKLTGRSLHE